MVGMPFVEPLGLIVLFGLIAVCAVWFHLWERLGVSTGTATVVWMLLGFSLLLFLR